MPHKYKELERLQRDRRAAGDFVILQWDCLHKNDIYERKQRQIDSNVSPSIYCAEVYRYMFRPSRGHH